MVASTAAAAAAVGLVIVPLGGLVAVVAPASLSSRIDQPMENSSDRTWSEVVKLRDELHLTISELRNETKVTSRWALGIAITVAIALAGNYITGLLRIEHMTVQIIEQGKDITDLQARIRTLEGH